MHVYQFESIRISGRCFSSSFLPYSLVRHSHLSQDFLSQLFWHALLHELWQVAPSVAYLANLPLYDQMGLVTIHLPMWLHLCFGWRAVDLWLMGALNQNVVV